MNSSNKTRCCNECYDEVETTKCLNSLCSCHSSLPKATCLHCGLETQPVRKCTCPERTPEGNWVPEVKHSVGDFRYKDTKKQLSGFQLVLNWDQWFDKNAHNLEMWTGSKWTPCNIDRCEAKEQKCTCPAKDVIHYKTCPVAHTSGEMIMEDCQKCGFYICKCEHRPFSPTVEEKSSMIEVPARKLTKEDAEKIEPGKVFALPTEQEEWIEELENIGSTESGKDWCTNSRENLIEFIRSLLSSRFQEGYVAGEKAKFPLYIYTKDSKLDIEKTLSNAKEAGKQEENNRILKILEDKQEVHKHNSIMNLYDGLKSGCITCMENDSLRQIMNLVKLTSK